MYIFRTQNKCKISTEFDVIVHIQYLKLQTIYYILLKKGVPYLNCKLSTTYYILMYT